MESDAFRARRRELSQAGLFNISTPKAIATVALEVTVTALLIYGFSQIDGFGPTFFALTVLAGSSIFRWFVILHECGHHSLFKSKRANTLVGHVASIACLIPYMPWRNIHLLHHRWVGVIDRDPTQAHLLNLRKAGKIQNALFRLIWRLWIPIPFIKFIAEIFWGYPLRGDLADRPKARRQGWFSIGLCVTAHVVVVALVGWRAWAAFFLPAMLVFYVLIETINLPQHSELFPYLSDGHPDPVPLREQDAITRSTRLPRWLGVVLTLNFTRHTEHHLFPDAPWYSLNKINDHLTGAGYRIPHDVPFGAFMREFRRRDPVTIYRDALPHPVTKGPAVNVDL